MPEDPRKPKPSRRETGDMIEMRPRPAVARLPRHHLDLVAEVVELVRRHGAGTALETLRRDRPAITGAGYHDTRAVFCVWAVDRLLTAGLTTPSLLWHPLLHEDSVYAWWSADVVDSVAAAEHFVPADRVLPGEPTPSEPHPSGPSAAAELAAA